MQIDDETLMALANGALDPERARSVRRAVDSDPALQARLERLGESGHPLRERRPSTDNAAQAKDRLAAITRGATEPPKRPVVPTANRNRRPWWAAAAAALVALALLGYGWWQSGSPVTNLAQSEITALQELRSGQVRGLEDGTQLSMVASFRGDAGQLCREYETVRDDTVRTVLACRGTQGWNQRFAAISRAKKGTFQPASEESSIDAALQAVGATQPLTDEEEAAALGSSAEGLPPG